MSEISERRQAPRFEVQLIGFLQTADGVRFNVEITNLSASGLQLMVESAAIPHIFSKVEQHNRLDPVHLSIGIQLPKQQLELLIEVGVVYFFPAAATRCAVGCRFETFIDGAASQLESYINSLC